ncbi:MAG TPA: transcription termination factor Rho [Vicinamibacteria bacterium]|nr:transcription termination factor Rho [Vicinamibacteria bacterium]
MNHGVSTPTAEGVLELEPQGNGHLRQESNNFLPRPQDVRVPSRLVAKHFLKEGYYIQGPSGMARRRNNRRGGPPHRELQAVESINGFKPEELPPPRHYQELVSEHPAMRLRMSQDPDGPISLRVIDLITPIGRGQRGLIVAAPKTGKTILLEQIGCAIGAFYPEIHLFVLLIDERPEEVTHMRRAVKGQVIASTSDGTSANHLRVARLVLERARRLVEMGDDVVILLDSITRLGRAANREQKGRGKTMTGGIDSRALEFPRQFFGAARNIEDGGSLTILGTALVDTGSQMDEVIFQEFKGTGNMELVLDRRLAEARIFPAIDISRSGTRREEILLDEEELPRVHLLRRALAGLKPTEAMALLLDKMKKTRTNKELLESIRIK